MDIKVELLKHEDKKYRDFHAKLVPGLQNNIGVRTPVLRKLAKSLVKDKGIEFVKTLSDDTYEEVLLQGFIIGYSKVDIECRLQYVEWYLPKITNWAICDLFVSTLKFSNKDIVFNWMIPLLNTQEEYTIRFVVVMMLSYFLNDDYIDVCLEKLNGIKHDGYYVKMAIAWAISIAYIKYPEKTLLYLKDCKLEKWTFNKAIQKIIESNRISIEEKDMLRKMKTK